MITMHNWWSHAKKTAKPSNENQPNHPMKISQTIQQNTAKPSNEIL
jgi:hypothetical protein